MELVTGNIGWIEVICGPMFSGKSEELIRRLRRARIARKRVQVFKPALDNRYSADEIVSHGDQRMDSEVVSNAKEMLTKLDWRTQVIGVDESNFFGPDLVDITAQLADTGKQVIIAFGPQRVPAHVWNAQIAALWKMPHLARQQPEARRVALLGMLEQQLHAETHAKQRLPQRSQYVDQTGLAQARHAGCRRAHARQNHVTGGADARGVVAQRRGHP